ncbi:uncharacterized protein LOC126354118 isoform X2 [Schistocerca gregaria]|nr:uncharacterized protein LOC126354118 isoform X2 [Schistocerca gregaria]
MGHGEGARPLWLLLVWPLLLAAPALCWRDWRDSDSDNDVMPATGEPDDYNVSTAYAGGALDILRLLNVSGGTPGVRVVAGLAPGLEAYRLRPAYGRVRLPAPQAVTAALTAPTGFTLVFVYRQQRKSLGTLLSVHSPGKVSPWLQLTSNQRTGQMLLHYRLQGDRKLHQLSWPLWAGHGGSVAEARRASSGWTHVAAAWQPGAGRLLVHLDCAPPRRLRLASRAPLHVPTDALVYFRQEPGLKKKFLGTIQVAKLLPYASQMQQEWTCNGTHPQLSSKEIPSVVAL